MIFYDIFDKDNSCVELGEGNDWEAIVCPINEGHQRAGNRITELKLELVLKEIVDFSWTILSDIVVTERVVEAFEKSGLKGYEVRQTSIVSLNNKNGAIADPIFWELVVTGTAGHAHPDSGIVLKTRCEACGLIRYSAYEHGIIIDENRWDGSDLFTVVEYPKHAIVTEKVKELIKKYEFTNIGFVRSDKLKWPEGVIKP